MAEPKTIVVIEDEASLRRVLDLKLRSQGYRVLLARDVGEGLAHIREARPDAVVLDLTLPGGDGRALCVEADALKAEKPFLTVITTGRVGGEDREWIAGLQDTVLLEKPFSTGALVGRLEGYFRGAR